MSGWIKWEKDLETDPRTLRMAKELKRIGVTGECHPVTVVCGALTRLWAYADSHIREDDTLDLGCQELDELLGVPGFCATMPKDWLHEIDADSVELPGFTGHNGVEAKKKALTQKRVSNHRLRSRNVEALPDQTRPDQTRPDQTRPKEEASSKPVAPKREDGPAERIFEHWRSEFKHPGAVLDPKRRRTIQRSLEAYDEETLKAAISGYKLSPHHMGQNDQRTVYDDISLFLRGSAHIERGLNFSRAPPVAAMSAVEIARANLRKQSNGSESRVVSEQTGRPGDGGVGSLARLLR
jgi:hypothetical protein